MGIEVTISENKLQEFYEKAPELAMQALEMCGQIAEGYAKMLAPVDTGNLRNSVTHNVKGFASFAYMEVGTDAHYAQYVEMGTGKYVSGGSPPWVYQDEEGNWHRTEGQPPKPFIKPSIADHVQEFMSIIKSVFQG